jgi:LppP/LprE lipoprotein
MARSVVALGAGRLLLLTLSVSAAQSIPSSWLDRPLVSWNKAGGPVPRAPGGDEAIASVIRRCQLTPPRSTSAERAVDTAGWIPYWNVDQQLVRDDVEIVGGMRGADGMCRPLMYNLFVFVGGRFAGVLSPTPMTSRLDSSSGVVRLPLPAITAEFARFASTDPLCCPSSRVTVRYRIDRTAAGPVVAPLDVRTTRP